MDNMKKIQRIAIVIDENKRTNLIEWSYFNREVLRQHEIIANEITSGLLQGTLDKPITPLLSQTGDGYREFSQMIERQEIDILIFFGDPSKPDTHHTAIGDLLIMAFNQNIITACNLVTADMVVASLQTGPSKRLKQKNKAAGHPGAILSGMSANGLPS